MPPTTPARPSTPSPSPRTRRLGAAGIALALAGGTLLAPPAVAASAEADRVDLTLLATTDVHGHVNDWDYFRDTPFPADDALGLTRIATAVDEVRAAEGEESVIVVDNGDAIQGTPLTYYYGLGDGAPGVLDGTTTHPMAAAFNEIGYDAQVVGNHEYNYGLDLLSAYEEQLDAPLLGANVTADATGQPYHEPYELIERTIDGNTVTVGVLGLVTPGVRVWDRQIVEGVLTFEDLVTSAQRWVPEVAEQADVVVVLAHSGFGTTPDAEYNAATLPEDAVGNIARMVPGIDVVVAGHSHQDEPETIVDGIDGPVLVTQPNYWARSVSEVSLPLVENADGGFDLDWSAGPGVTPHYANEPLAESPAVSGAIADQHAQTVEYVNTPVATSTEELLAESSRYEDTPIIDFINDVQQATVADALASTEYADVPVVSQASPFSRTARFPEGQVTIRDVAGLYIYENTLRGVLLTGAQLKDYLEFSARYFVQTEEGAEFDPETGTNAVYPDRPGGVPDYNYDALTGLDYTIDVSRNVGDRIQGLSHPDGEPVAADDEFVLAVNNYRQSGGGAFPHVADAPVVYDELQEVRQLLIESAQERGVIDPADFFVENWTLTTSTAVAPAPEPTPDPTDPAPTPVPTDPAPTPAPTDPAAGGPGSGDDAQPVADAGDDALATTGSQVPWGAIGAGALLIGLGSTVLLVSLRRRVAAE